MKNINQYKSAMDNIKISDSFINRTEILMREQGKNNIEVSDKRKKRKNLKITMWSGIAAAAIATLLVVKVGIARQEDISSTVTDATISSDSVTTETTVAVISDLNEETKFQSEENNEFNGLDIDDNPTSEAAEAPAVQIVQTEKQTEQTTTAAETAAKTETNTNTNTNTVTSSPTQTTAQTTSQADSSDAAIVEEAAAPNENTVDYAQNNTASLDAYDDYPAYEDEDIEEAAPESASLSSLFEVNNDAQFASSLHGIDFNSAEGELTTYVGNASQSDITLSKEDMQSFADLIADASSAVSSEPHNPDFTSEFVLTIKDKTYSTVYTVYVTADRQIVININYTYNGQQYRKTYSVSNESFNKIEKTLFLKFGTEAEYNEFLNSMTVK